MRRFAAACALVFAGSAFAAIPSSERDALVAVYQSTNGPAWTDKTNWLGAAGSECTWFGVTCDEQQAHVLSLDLYQNNLDGTLPADLRKLTALQSAQFWQNKLRGSLPPELSELSRLETLLAGNNQFTGRVPAAWGALKKLKTLGLDGNALTGPLPAQLGDMSAMEELGLSYNQITGSIPKELANLTNLRYLWLSVNMLTGSIPKELGSMPKLEVLSIESNRLSGSIPAELGDLPAIFEIDIPDNELTGGIPAALGKAKTLEILSLFGNPLGGPIPKELGNLPAIRVLNLAGTNLTGTIPVQLWDLDTLEELQLGGNDLKGAIPADIAKLTNLQVLGLYSNDFDGAIPAAIANIAPLRSLELQGNAFTGAIPPELSRLTSLTWMDLAGNQLTGSIPRQLSALANLEVLSLYDNRLSGAIPGELTQLANLRLLYLGGNALTGALLPGLGALTNLQQFTINGNRLTGPVPPGLETLEKMEYLDLSFNELSGRFPDLSRMKDLRSLYANDNLFTGPLPPGIGTLTNLTDLFVHRNAMTGPIPRELGGLASVEYLYLGENAFDGSIPPELGNLPKVREIALWENRLGGTIPKELGNLASLQSLNLSGNALRGPIPKEITKLTKLDDKLSDFGYNALFTTDESVRAFVNAKHHDGDFEATQTVPPTGEKVAQTTDRSATLTWMPIRYSYDGGGYQVVVSKTANGAPFAVATTSTKESDSITVRNLEPGTQYFFTVSTVTHPHDSQKNLITSDAARPLSASTGARVVAPADVVVVEQPAGMVRVDGAEVVADSFTVTNFGDVATNLTLDHGGDFDFTVTPETFSLNGGATQVVTLHSQPKNAGTYYGYVAIQGTGTDDDDVAFTALLAATRPVGTVIATPLATTVEVSGTPGADSVGVAQFRNTGTAPLTGIVVSDQPWIEVPSSPITIEPGTIGTVNFKIKRARRPASEGALVANLRLVYVSGGTFVRGIGSLAAPPTSGVSVSIVTVVDTTRPAVSTGPIPSPGAGELPLFIPGIRSSPVTRSDLALFNAHGTHSIGDLKLYFTRGAQTSIAALQPLAASAALNLVNVVDSIYDTEGSGTLQVRTAEWESVGADAKVTAIAPDGTRGGAIPVFRGDRSILQGESLYLAGIAAPGDVLLQETGGASAAVHVVYLDASGAQVGTRDALLDRYELAEWSDAIPGNAATAIVTSISGTFTAYARLRDASGDVWSVVDWSQFYRYRRDAVVRVPFADGRGGATRRRVVRNDAASRSSTSLVLFNPGNDEARARIDTLETSGRTSTREVTIASHTTVTLSDAASSSATSTAQLVITPARGEIAVTARSRASAGGTAIPVLDASTGLRLGQRHTFTALDDAASQRTSFGFAETSGASVTIRARIFIEGANALVTTVTERDYELAPNAQLVVPELVRAFAGEARDSLGDLHNLVLELEVVAGGGAVVPFVLATDEGTGDTSLAL